MLMIYTYNWKETHIATNRLRHIKVEKKKLRDKNFDRHQAKLMCKYSG